METARRSEKSTERGGVTDESFTGNFKNIKSPGVLLRDVPKRDAGALNNTWRDDLVQIGDKQYRTGRNDADLRVCRRCRQRLFPQRMDRIKHVCIRRNDLRPLSDHGGKRRIHIPGIFKTSEFNDPGRKRHPGDRCCPFRTSCPDIHSTCFSGSCMVYV